MSISTRVIPTSSGDIRVHLDPHTWLYDVRAMLRMLEGDIGLPHLHGVKAISTDRKGEKTNIEVGCRECSKAARQRRNHLDQKKQLDISLKL